MVEPRQLTKATGSRWAWLLAACVLAPAAARAQAADSTGSGAPPDSATEAAAEPAAEPAAEAATEAAAEIADLSVEPAFDPGQWRRTRDPIDLVLNRALEPARDGRLAIVLGGTDLSALYRLQGTRLRYDSSAPPLPAGEGELVVYRETPSDEWLEVTRIPIRILSRFGLESQEGQVLAGLNNAGQLAQGRNPGNAPLGRERFQDFSLNLGWQDAVTKSGVRLESRASFVGVSQREQALRFNQRAERAPLFDLAEYAFRVGRDRTSLTFGHVSLATSRYLADGVAGRGLTADYRLTRFAQLSTALVSGSQLVGFDDLIGIRRPDHRMFSSALGLHWNSQRGSNAQLTASVLDGSVLPIADFVEGAVLQAEKSRGLSLEMRAADAKQRLTVQGAWARSRFTDPAAAEVTPFGDIVPAPPTERDARFGQAQAVVLRGDPARPGAQPSLKLGGRVERVDPLYRSVAAAATPSDRLARSLTLESAYRGVEFTADATSSHNNLNHVASLLTTQSRQGNVRMTAPLANLLSRTKPPRWAPALMLQLQRGHQFAEAAPPNGGFTPSFVPDQVSTNGTASAQWQGQRWAFAYSLGLSHVDNRQSGRQDADFRGAANALHVSLQPSARFSVGLDGALERQRAAETGHLQNTRRGSIQGDVRPDDLTTLSVFFGGQRSADAPRTSESLNGELRVEFTRSLRFLKLHRHVLPVQAFLRYGHQHTRGTAFGEASGSRQWLINSGFNFSWS